MRDNLELLPLSEDAALIFGALKKAIQDSKMLSLKNIRQHNVDVMIAANTIVLNGTVVSEDKIFAENSGIR